MAGSTGFEPATSGLTVQCANQAAPRARVVFSRAWRTRVKHTMARRARKRARELAGRLLKVAGAHDVVAVEDGPGPVAGDGHRHPLGDARVDHVPDRGAPAVVPQHPRDARLLAGW